MEYPKKFWSLFLACFLSQTLGAAPLKLTAFLAEACHFCRRFKTELQQFEAVAQKYGLTIHLKDDLALTQRDLPPVFPTFTLEKQGKLCAIFTGYSKTDYFETKLSQSIQLCGLNHEESSKEPFFISYLELLFARKDYARVVEITKDTEWPFLDEGQRYERLDIMIPSWQALGETTEARKLLRRAIYGLPKSGKYFLSDLANTYGKEGQFLRGMAVFDRQLRANPDQLHSLIGQSSFALTFGQTSSEFSKGIRALQKARQLVDESHWDFATINYQQELWRKKAPELFKNLQKD